MGNQGMTNWKFSMFFVIALTLVAGLFADTALAGNGDGKMVLGYGTAGGEAPGDRHFRTNCGSGRGYHG